MEKLIATILRSLGVSITPETIKMLETLIPQIPSKINQVIAFINDRWKEQDERLARIESVLERLQQDGRQPGSDDLRPATIGKDN